MKFHCHAKRWRSLGRYPQIGDKCSGSAYSYVFTLNGTAPYNGFKAKDRLNEIVGIAPWTVHDLRRSAPAGWPSLEYEPCRY